MYDGVRHSDAASLAPRTPYGSMKLLNEQQASAFDVFARCCGVRIVNVYHDGLGRGQTGWLSTAIHLALSGRSARVNLAPAARMAIIWAQDLGERLAAIALSPREDRWPPVVDSGGQEATGRELAQALERAGARDVELGADRYPYPSVVSSPWLDRLAGAQAVPLADALLAMARMRAAATDRK